MLDIRKILRIIKQKKIGAKTLVVIMAGVLLFSGNSFMVMAQTVSENTEINALYTEEVKTQEQESSNTRTQIVQNVGTENDDDNKIVLYYTSMELELGEIERACPGVKGSHPDEYWNDITWTSSDESVAVVVSPGAGYGEYVQAISAGNCTITAYLASKPEVRATCEVKVYDSISHLSLNQSEVELEAYTSVQLNATILPKSAKQDIIWRSSDASVATVDEKGVVTASGRENAICQIYAFSSNRKLFAVCDVKVCGADVPSPDIQDGYIVKPIQDGDLIWSIDANGHLKISGNGNIEEDCWADWLEYVKYIKSAEVNASGMNSTAWWFADCKYLTDVDISNLDTTNVTDMTGMFEGCARLLSINGVDKLNTSNVKAMEDMFSGCLSIKELNLSSFDTSKVVEIDWIFNGCSNLKKLNLSGWTFDWNIVRGEEMFKGCFSLTELNLSKTKMICDEWWDVAELLAIDSDKVQTYTGPAEYLDTRYFSPVNKIDLSGAEFENCVEIQFNNDFWIESLNLKNIKVDNLESMSGMFFNCSELKELNLSGFDTSNVIDMTVMFYGCSSLKEVDVSNFDTSRVIYMGGMFEGCSSLTNLDVSDFNTRQVTEMERMFVDCIGLTNLNISNFNVSQAPDMYNMFKGCNNLTQIFMPQNVNDYIEFPSVEGYCWIDSNGKICEMVTESLSTPMVYNRISNTNLGDSNDENSNAPSDTNPGAGDKTENETGILENDDKGNNSNTNPQTGNNQTQGNNPQTPSQENPNTISTLAKKGTKITSEAVSGKFTVTSTDTKNPTVAYTGTTNKKKKTIIIPDTITYEGVNYAVTSISAKAFKGNKKLTTVKIGSNVTKIDNSAFEGCTSLKTVTIGKGLKTIGKNTFKNCKKLKSLTIKSSNLKTVGKNALKGIHAKCKIKVPSKKVNAYKKLLKGKGQKSSVKISK